MTGALLVTLLLVTVLMPAREATAQKIDCTYLCWTFPCILVCGLDPREKPEQLLAPVPTDEMYAHPEAIL